MAKQTNKKTTSKKKKNTSPTKKTTSKKTTLAKKTVTNKKKPQPHKKNKTVKTGSPKAKTSASLVSQKMKPSFLIKLVEGLMLVVIFIVVLFCALKKPKIKVNIGSNFFKVVDQTSKINKYKKENSYTIIGWLRIQGTNINYPVLLYEDAPISDVRQNIGWTYFSEDDLYYRTVIEGHNIMNMSSIPKVADKSSRRFEQLLSFWDPKFVENNKYIEYTTNNKNYVFKIVAVSFAEIEDDYLHTNYDKQERKNYLEQIKKESLYDFDVDVNESDKLISIYTCTRFYGYSKAVVFRVDGRLLRKNEKIKNYDFKTTENYTIAKAYSDSKKKTQEVSS